jgi:hypothetical protein
MEPFWGLGGRHEILLTGRDTRPLYIVSHDQSMRGRDRQPPIGGYRIGGTNYVPPPERCHLKGPSAHGGTWRKQTA